MIRHAFRSVTQGALIVAIVSVPSFSAGTNCSAHVVGPSGFAGDLVDRDDYAVRAARPSLLAKTF